jgi:hypothetical protein
MGFITMLPRISDLACCPIFAREPGSEDTGSSSSYIVLPSPDTTTTTNKAYTVYLGSGKAARTTLPPRLTELIRCSLEHTPRDHLFTYCTARSGHQPSPYTARSFNAWCAKVLREATNNPDASLKLCLQAFISEYLADSRTAKKKASVLADILGTHVGWVLKQRRTIRPAEERV